MRYGRSYSEPHVQSVVQLMHLMIDAVSVSTYQMHMS